MTMRTGGWKAIALSAEHAPAAGAFSPAAEAGGLIFVAGQVPRDPLSGQWEKGRPLVEQVRRVFDNLALTLGAAGVGLGDVVSVTVYLADIAAWSTVNALFQEYFRPPYPARAVVGAALEGFLIEVAAVAARPGPEQVRPPSGPGAELRDRFATLTTPMIADASLRLGRPVRCAPPEVRPLVAGQPIAGRALPVRHLGSVDVFLAALEGAAPGDVLVVDNEGRRDEGCLGDLVGLESATAGIGGVVVWGAVRDTAELIEIGLPVYCTGRCPVGPRGLRPPPEAAGVHLGSVPVSAEDVVFGDDDGVLILAGADVGPVLDAAAEIARRERAQAERARSGECLRRQFRFADYLARKAQDPAYTFREHLARVEAAIEV
jgi:4-hydroxy-4-methyl-2-oxoglutarate aldolase